MPKRVGVSIQAAFILFVVSSLVGFYFLRGMPELKSRVLLLAISIPAISALAVVLITGAVEGILPGRKLVFPTNLTLPLMHVAIMAVVVRLMLTTSNPLEALPDQVLPALIWENWRVLALCAVGESTLLSLFIVSGAGK
jgi:hypothetical protein